MRFAAIPVLFCLSAFLALPACSKPVEKTVEEKILHGMFADFILATQYDKICNNDIIGNAPDGDPVKDHYFGNAQVLGGRMALVWKIRNPDGDQEDAVEDMLDMQEKFGSALGKDLTEQGCDSATGKAGAIAYRFYTQTHPGLLGPKIDKNIVDAGGTVSVVPVPVEENPSPAP